MTRVQKHGRDQRPGAAFMASLPRSLRRAPRPPRMDRDDVAVELSKRLGERVDVDVVRQGAVPPHDGAGGRFSTNDVGHDLMERNLILVIATVGLGLETQVDVCHLLSEAALREFRDPWRSATDALTAALRRALRTQREDIHVGT